MAAASNQGSPERPPKPPILSLETIGLLVISILILLFILIRYGRDIPWGAR